MPNSIRKVSIVGCGNVGMRFAYSLVIEGIARELVLVDYMKEKAAGEAMDLSDGGPFISPIDIYSGDYSDTVGSDLVVITAGAGRKPGQTRMELAKGNVEIIKEIVSEIVKYSPEAVILMVSNPVDVLSYVAYKVSGKPSGQIIGSGTLLDTARLVNLLKDMFEVNVRSIYAPIFGEHGETAFPAWSKVTIGGMPVEDAFCSLTNTSESRGAEAACGTEAVCGTEAACGAEAACGCKKELDRIFQETKDRGKEIIKRKGETSYGIGISLTKIAKAVLKDENSVLSVSTLLEDYYGISNVFLSVPAVINRQGVKKILKINFNEEEIKALHHSAEEVKKVIKEVGF
ncbi:MAG: L-lactate dehydrogenase [Endomicrobia bacterium]|nr:L-lactate dehydrogenase [Endomicrobiia bacterium]